MNEFRLDGKVALISGSARGLGAAMAATLAAGGAKIIIADVLDSVGRDTAGALGADNAMFVHLDVTKEEDWEASIAAAVKRFGGIDVVVNNAGIETASLLENCTLEEFNLTLNVNVSGVFLGVKRRRRRGSSRLCPRRRQKKQRRRDRSPGLPAALAPLRDGRGAALPRRDPPPLRRYLQRRQAPAHHRAVGSQGARRVLRAGRRREGGGPPRLAAL